jgi:hypothetical protein
MDPSIRRKIADDFTTKSADNGFDFRTRPPAVDFP